MDTKDTKYTKYTVYTTDTIDTIDTIDSIDTIDTVDTTDTMDTIDLNTIDTTDAIHTIDAIHTKYTRDTIDTRYTRDCDEDGGHLYRQPPSSQSRVHRVTQLLTDGAYRQESPCTGPGVLKVVRLTGALNAYIQETRWTIFCADPFSPRRLLNTVALLAQWASRVLEALYNRSFR